MAKLAKSSKKTPKPDQPEAVEKDDALTESDSSQMEDEAQAKPAKADADTESDAIEDAEILDTKAAEPEPQEKMTEEASREEASEPRPEQRETDEIAQTPDAEDGRGDTTPPPVSQPRRRGGVLPLLIGGLAAGGIGYGVETYLDNQQAAGPDLVALLEDQAASIEALGAEIDAIPPAPDLSPLRDRIAAVEDSVADDINDLEATLTERIAALDERLTEVEKRPGSDGTLSESALAAYERELDALRADLAAQRQEVTAIAEQAAEDLNAARAEAEKMEQQALQEARAAAGRAALNRLRVAVDSGEPFADLLGDLEQVAGQVPSELKAVAETGVATQAALEDQFDSAARAALAAARDEGVAGESGGLGTFLRQQFDVRSTQPREGSDPDAVLSRAEAAVESDRLSDALAEIATLPEVSRAAMTGWTAEAQARADALAAVADLSETLNTN